MRFFLPFVLACLMYCTCQAQNDRGYAGLSVGAALPLGDFGDRKGFNQNSGLATMGSAVELSAGILLGQHIGIATLIRRQSHGIDDNVIKSRFSGRNSLSVESENYRLTSFMGGLYTSFPISEQWSLDFRFLFGFAISRFPNVDISGPSDANGWPFTVRLASKSADALALDAGAGLRYHISDQLCLLLSIDYWNTSPSINISQSGTSGNQGMRLEIEEIITLNAALGIAWRL